MGVLREVIDEQIACHRGRLAVGDSRGALTYAELGAAADEFAAGLVRAWRSHATARPGSGPPRVMICAGNSKWYVTAYLGCLRAGAVPFLLDPLLTSHEVAAIAASCGSTLLMHDRPRDIEGARLLHHSGALSITALPSGSDLPPPPLHPDTEVCRFTSGSTGVPNCIEFSGNAVLSAARAWNAASGTASDDRILCFAGLFNGLAFNTSLLPALLAGASLWLPAGLPSAGQVARFLRELRPTRLTGFPALYESLLRRDADLPEMAGLRVALSSAAPLSAEVRAAVRARYGLAVCNYYGIAETGPLTFDPEPAADEGLGRPLPGVRIVVADPAGGGDGPGELLVSSSSMGTRYLNVPGGLERRVGDDGLYRTDDVGQFRAGRLFLLGRGGKGINIGGRKIDPAEVRSVLESAPGVAAAVVFTVDRAETGPMLVAAVTGPVADRAEGLRAHCRTRLAPYKVPERFLVLPSLPLTSLGKPRMSVLRALALEHRERHASQPGPGTGDLQPR